MIVIYAEKASLAKAIATEKVIRLIEKGKTSLIKGFKSKAGKEFDAYLVVDKTAKKSSLSFRKKVIIPL